MARKDSTPIALPLALSLTNLLRDNSCSSDNSSPTVSKKKLKTQKSSFGIQIAKHDLDTIDDGTLIEEIKDLLEKYNQKANHIDMNTLEQQIFTDLKCNNNYKLRHLQTRIIDIIHDIYHQQGIEIPDDPLSPTLSFDEKDIDHDDITVSSFNVFDNIEDVAHFQYDDQELIELDPEIVNKIKNEFNTKMNKLLPQSQKILKEQCRNESCKNALNGAKISDILNECPCLQRICVFLDIYYQFHHELNIEKTINIANYLQMDGYDRIVLHEDFLHIHTIHMHKQHEMQKLICGAIHNKYPCKISKKNKCYIKKRHKHFMDKKSKKHIKTIPHFKSNNPIIHNNKNNNKHEKLLSIPETIKYVKSDCKDIIMIQLVDMIHCYFLHSKVKYGCKFDKANSIKLLNNSDDEIEEKEDEQIFEFYGEQEDKTWMNSIMDDRYKLEHEQQIYERLVSKMGVFSWQGAHGFRIGQSQDYMHIKARYKNVKEEVLNNIYWRLTISNWNTTVAKVMQFNKSFASEKMRTDRNGHYDDQTMYHKETWKRGETPSIKEITVIKLYTDWDELQSELKKCFRVESVDDIVENYAAKPTLMNRASEPVNNLKINKGLKMQLSALRTTLSAVKLKKSITKQLSLDEATNVLKQRLSEFFHWRGSLLIFINKFSEIISPKHKLYHGVNRRMILNPSSTQSFYGPLSTTSSYYVAQTFATDKGMILSIGSKYPRLGMCNAFDASPISDYPEEQEFLIGHIYMRIKTVYTKVFEHIPIDSKLRYAFFALHLFSEQIFSFNPILETYIIPFIQIHLNYINKCNEKWLIKLINIQQNSFKYLKQILEWRTHEFTTETPRLRNNNNNIKTRKRSDTPNDVIKKSRIFYILIKKFNEFCHEPNLKQILRLDCISIGLRPYFLKKTDEKLNGEDLYEISFKKLITLFPNTEQIYFFNWYKFDNKALKKLIIQIKRNDNKLKAIKFLYYDYNDPLDEHPFFFDDKKLKQESIEKLNKHNWTIHSKLDKTGYSIKLKRK